MLAGRLANQAEPLEFGMKGYSMAVKVMLSWSDTILLSFKKFNQQRFCVTLEQC